VVHARLRSLRFGIRRSQTVFISPQTSPCLSPHAIPRRQLRENTPHCAAIPGDRGRIAMRIISRPNIYCIPPISGRNIIGPLFHPGIHRVLPMLLSLSLLLFLAEVARDLHPEKSLPRLPRIPRLRRKYSLQFFQLPRRISRISRCAILLPFFNLFIRVFIRGCPSTTDVVPASLLICVSLSVGEG